MHAIEQPPQLFTSVMVLTHWPLHDVVPTGQPHALPLHSWPGAQATLHAPQWASWVVRSAMHAVPLAVVHGVSPWAQLALHTPSEQNGALTGQIVPQPPQLEGSDIVSMQPAPQLVPPLRQAQVPLWQN